MKINPEKVLQDTDHQEGICPLCGAELTLEEWHLNPNGVTQPWECPKCGASGVQEFVLVFSSHEDVESGDGADDGANNNDCADADCKDGSAEKPTYLTKPLSKVRVGDILLDEDGVRYEVQEEPCVNYGKEPPEWNVSVRSLEDGKGYCLYCDYHSVENVAYILRDAKEGNKK